MKAKTHFIKFFLILKIVFVCNSVLVAQTKTILFDKLEYDLGQIKESNDSTECSFVFINNDIKPLIIQSAISIFSNADIKYTREEVLPQETGIVSVKLIFKGKSGNQNISISVFSNAEPSRVELKIKADIISNSVTKAEESFDISNLNVSNMPEKWGSIGSSKSNITINRVEKNLVLSDSNGASWNLKKGGNIFSLRDSKSQITLEYLNEKSIKIKQVKSSDVLGLTSSTTSTYRIVKDMTEKLDLPSKFFSKYGLVFRYTFNQGKIGEDYVPVITESYNAGKTFYISGIEVKEKDMRTYVVDGGYNKDIIGYTYVYQILNPTDKIYKISFTINGNGKYPNIEKSGFWDFTYDRYKSIDEFKNFESTSFVVIHPNETFKDQTKVGTTIPIDLEFSIDKIEELDRYWLNGLQKALNVNSDILTLLQYINDPKADSWYERLIENKKTIVEKEKIRNKEKYLPFITKQIKPTNELFFDKDFESDIIYSIKNSSDKELQITYHLCNKKDSTIDLKPKEQFSKTQKIKGYSKESLSLSIDDIMESSSIITKLYGNNSLERKSTSSSVIYLKPEIEWINIAGGSFIMGSPESEEQRDNDEIQHRVTVSDFRISKYEVTFEQYDAFCNATGKKKPSDQGWGRGNRPVINIQWSDAKAFADWMGCRLPTEAEWEYACRTGTTGPFNTGTCLSTSQANYNGNYPCPNCNKGGYSHMTLPVGSFHPDKSGLCDMHGNVYEYCSDLYGPYSVEDQINPKGQKSGKTNVFRGGSWYSDEKYCRSANRGNTDSGVRPDCIGFRLVSN